MRRVYRAVNIDDHRVAACKMVTLTPETTETERKTIDKEMRVHSALKHKNVLEFFSAYVVEPGKPSPYHPGIYMLLELAAGGDLFDKIGELSCLLFCPDAHPYVPLESSRRRHRRRHRTSLFWPTCRRRCKHPTVASLIPLRSSCMPGIHTRRGHMSSRSQARKHPARRRWDSQDLRLWSQFSVQTERVRQDPVTDRTLWQPSIRRARGKSNPTSTFPHSAAQFGTFQLNSKVPYEAEPIDVWGLGVILFTLLSGSE